MSTYQSQNDNRKDKGGLSWTATGVGCFIFFVIGAWPLCLLLLAVKCKQVAQENENSAVRRESNPAEQAAAAYGRTAASSQAGKPEQAGQTRSKVGGKAGATLLQILGAGVGIAGVIVLLVVLTNVLALGVFPPAMAATLVTGLSLFGAGWGTFLAGYTMKRKKIRFLRYLAVIGQRDSVSAEELAQVTGQKKSRVLKDLHEMLENRLFPEGAYVDQGREMLFRSFAAAQAQQSREQPSAPPPPKETEEGYSGILRSIRRVNDSIADPELSAKIDRLEEISGKIFRIVEEKPERTREIRTFLDYYLPTTQKLLEAYSNFESAGVEGENLKEAKGRIAEIMDAILAGFERQLDQLYRSDAMDIDSEIRVMETMLKRDSGQTDFFPSATAKKPSP